MKKCKQGHHGPWGLDGRCLTCRREREKVPPEKRVTRRKAKTYHGKECEHCHGTLRYESNRACVFCVGPKGKQRRIVDDEPSFPTRTIVVRRFAMLPLHLEIPVPPMPELLTRPWGGASCS